MDWQYYNHMIVQGGDPREEKPALSKADAVALFSKHSGAFLIRYVTEYDRPVEGEWYYCVKDDAYAPELLKSKRRNVLRKATSNFRVKPFAPMEHISEMQTILNDAGKGYAYQKAELSLEQTKEKCEILSRLPNAFFLGAFLRENDQLVGYLWIGVDGKRLSMVEQHCIREYERLECNAALVDGLCTLYTEKYLPQGHYLCDGERNVVHETAFQEYLAKYFGFRKAYCKLNIVYRPIVKIPVKFAYLLWPILSPILKHCKKAVWSSLNGVMTLERIVRKQHG